MTFIKRDIERTQSVVDNEQQPANNVSDTSKKKKSYKSFPLLVALLGVVFVLILTINVFGLFKGFSVNFPSQVISGISEVFGKDLKKDPNGHTNILIVGIGGAEHDGANLTDTLMVASIDSQNHSVALLSIPRDLYINVPQMGPTKINAAYDFNLRQITKADGASNAAKTNTPPTFNEVQEGMQGLQDIVENITGVSIQYFVKADFQGFIQVVDLLGGVDVDVPRDLIDREYPNESYGYETFAVRKGMRHFDGATALKYARSRHSTSDFDRSERQHTIMKAVLDKVMEKQYLTDPNQLKRLYYAVSENIVTNMDLREILRGAGFAKDLKGDHILSAGFHDDYTKEGGFLYVPQRALFGGASVLLPSGATAGNLSYYKQLQQFAEMFLFSQAFYSGNPKILVVNATKSGTKRISGIGQSISSTFVPYGINIEESVNAPDQTSLTTSTIVAMNDNAMKTYIPHISNLFNAEKLQFNQDALDAFPEVALSDFLAEQQSHYDIVILVGNDYRTLLAAN
ncbi:MAG: LCP family protein [Candidatus Gracilibacteria bacterium]